MLASVTAAVLALEFAAIPSIGVVAPEAMVTVQAVAASSSAAFAVSVTVAVTLRRPDRIEDATCVRLPFDATAVNVVSPQPEVVGAASVPKTKFGTTRVIVSSTLIATGEVKANDTDD
jgi:hypothetical protein